MTDTKKEVINEIYDNTLLTTGIVGVSYLRRSYLLHAVAGSAFAIGYLKDKGYIQKTIDK